MTGLPPPQDPRKQRLDAIMGGGGGGKPQAPRFGNLLSKEGARDSELAEGVLESTGLHILNGAKALGDSIANIGVLGAKAAYGVGSMMQGEGFSAGWEQAKQQMQADVGTTNPGVLDLMLVRKDGETGVSIGEQAQEVLNKRLGNAAIASHTVGNLASFMTGPGAMVGRAAAAPARALTTAGSNVLAKAVAKKAGLSLADDAAQAALKSGRVWDYLSTLPNWQRNAGLVDKLLATAGKSRLDLVGTTAANIAQNYAMSQDDMRLAGIGQTALMSLFAVPFARGGEWIANKIAAYGISPDDAKIVTRAFADMEAGKISYRELDRALRQSTSPSLRFLANGVAGAAEGTAFTMISPDAWDLHAKWQAGDEDAGAQLMAMLLGSAGGVVLGKQLVPPDLAPLFKTLRPDQNVLSTYIEAAANRKVAQQQPKPPANPQEPQFDVGVQQIGAPRIFPQEPQKPGMVSKIGDIAARDAAAEAAAYEAQMRSIYGWAEQHADTAIRGGFEPEFVEGSSDVILNHGRDFSVRLSQHENGEVVLHLDPKVSEQLAEFGRPLKDYKTIAPTMVELRGAEATRTLNDLSLLATLRKMQGALMYGRAGMREIVPGIHADQDGNQYTMQLDGSSAVRGPYDGNRWKERRDIYINGDEQAVQFENQSLALLKDWLVNKQAISPDLLVDNIFARVIELAERGNTIGASELRQFFEGTQWEAIANRLKDGEDRFLAMELGTLGSGDNNASNVVAELSADAQFARGDATKQPSDRPQFEAAMQGETLPDAEGIRANELQEYREQMEMAVVERPFAERFAPRQSEPPKEGRVGSAGLAIKEAVEVSRGPIKEATDYLITPQMEVLRKNLPDEPLPYEARRVIARGEELIGSYEEPLRSAEKAIGKARVEVEGEGGKRTRVPLKEATVRMSDQSEMMRWRALVDGKVEPANDRERAIVEAAQESLLMAWNTARAAGETRMENVKGEMRRMPLPARDKAVVPYSFGQDFQRVMDKAPLRKAWFQEKAALNPEQMIPVYEEGSTTPVIENGRTKMEPISGEGLERMWFAEVAGRTKGGKAFDEEVATEFVRQFKNMPDRWKAPDGVVYEMMEPDFLRAMTRTLQRQARRTATVERYGQDIPADQRAAMLADETLPAEVRANLEKGGLEARMQAFRATTAKMQDRTYAQSLEQTAESVLSEIQGISPFERTRLTKRIENYTAWTSAARIVKAFVYDVPEMASRGWTFAGTARTLKALVQTFKNPREAIRYGERLGVIQRELADFSITEARQWLRKSVNALLKPGNMMERTKAAVATKWADLMIADAKAGKADTFDMQVYQDLLTVSPEDLVAIQNGRISPELESQLRRELVQLATSRGRPIETSRFAASPNTNAVVRFLRFATRRLYDTIKATASVGRAIERHGAMSPQAAAAYWRTTKLLTGITAGGWAGQALGAMVSGLLKGDPWEGLEKFVNQTAYAPFAAATKAFAGGVAGGPYSMMLGALQDPDDARALWKLTSPGELAYGLTKAVSATARGDVGSLASVIGDIGLIPLNTEAKHWPSIIGAWWAGTDKNVASDIQFVREFRRIEGIKLPYGTKDPERRAFYDAMANVITKVREAGGNTEQALRAAMDDIRSALKLAPEESVAGSILGHRLISNLTNEQRTKIEDLANDDERMRRIYNHDQVLTEIARQVRRMEGTNQSAWEAELDQVTRQAQLGASDRWRGLVDRALDDAVVARMAGQSQGSAMEELADRLALFPLQTKGIVDDKAFRRISNPDLSPFQVSRMLQAIFRKRIADRVRAERAEDVQRKREERR